MKTVAIIPARIGSDEIHAKVLLDLGGKPVIQHVYERTVGSEAFDEILLAVDDERIRDTVETFGARAVLTKKEHVCGSDRCAEAAAAHFPDADIVVNIQADEPFLHPGMFRQAIEPLVKEEGWDLSTLCCRFLTKEAADFIFNVKVVKSKPTSRALYFSRSVIPFPRGEDPSPWYQHIGVYAYRAEALQTFARFGPSELEMTEGLEQLRALEAELRIKVVETDLPYKRIAINTKQDIEEARRLLETGEEGKG